jgi:hypothetical protein
MTCDPKGATDACVDGTSCVQSGMTATCIANGSTGADCSATAPACAAGDICGSKLSGAGVICQVAQ